MTEKILFFISAKGEIIVDFSGFSGEKCIEVGKELQERLRENGIDINITKQVRKTTDTQREVTENVIKH